MSVFVVDGLSLCRRLLMRRCSLVCRCVAYAQCVMRAMTRGSWQVALGGGDLAVVQRFKGRSQVAMTSLDRVDKMLERSVRVLIDGRDVVCM